MLSISTPQTVLSTCTLNRVRWQIATDFAFNNIAYDTGELNDPPHNVHKVPDNTLNFGTKYYFRAKLFLTINQGGNLLPADIVTTWSPARRFNTEGIVVNEQCTWPEIYNKSPADEVFVDTLTPTLEIGFTGAVQLPACEYDRVAWQVAETVQAFELIAILTSDGLQLNNPVPLRNNTTYYWQARLYANDGSFGPWSRVTSFNIQTLFIVGNPPCTWPSFSNLEPRDGAVDVPVDPLLKINIPPNQLVQDPACEHSNSNFQISTDPDFNNIVFDFISDRGQWWQGIIVNPRLELQLVGDAAGFYPLQPGTNYYWRALLRGGGKESRWSNPTSFTTAGQAGGNRNINPNPNPPNINVNDLCGLDVNENGVIDDGEFFAAVDLWISEVMDNPLFFSAVDAWIGQLEVCAVAAEIDIFQPINLSQNSHGAIFATQGNDTESISAQVFDLQGRLVFQGSSIGPKLHWNLKNSDGVSVANGVYFYATYTTSADGKLLRSKIHKLVLMR
jgi:hypothetical protein